MIWELDDGLNYVGALYGFKQYGQRVPVYKLYKRSDHGVLQRVGAVSAAVVRVPLREVGGLTEYQLKAIEHDRGDGSLDGLY